MSGTPSSCYYADLLTIQSFFRRGSGRLGLTAFVEWVFGKETGVRMPLYTLDMCNQAQRGRTILFFSQNNPGRAVVEEKS
jgi:hypothetical protein